MFLETSALTGENVEEAFVQCARKILNKIESGRPDVLPTGSGALLISAGELEIQTSSFQVNWIQRGWARGSSMATPPSASFAPPAAPSRRAPRSVAASGAEAPGGSGCASVLRGRG